MISILLNQFTDILATVDLEGEVLARFKNFQNYLVVSGGDIKPTPPRGLHNIFKPI